MPATVATALGSETLQSVQKSRFRTGRVARNSNRAHHHLCSMIFRYRGDGCVICAHHDARDHLTAERCPDAACNRGNPPTSVRFLPGIPFDPPRAGIGASAVTSGFGIRTLNGDRRECDAISLLLLSDQMIDLEGTRLGIPETGMLAHRTLAALLAPAELVVGRRACHKQPPDALLATGRRPSARRVEALGCRWRIPVWHLEDGLLRSLKKGRDHPPLCLLIDDLGVHFDCTAPSRIEQRIGTALTPDQANRARMVRTLWRRERLSKLNPVRESPHPQPYVLVADQSAGDLSIAMGGADAGCFQQMLQTALIEHPHHLVVVKVHPDVIRGKARGHFLPSELDHPRIQLSADGLHPAALLEHADVVAVCRHLADGL